MHNEPYQYKEAALTVAVASFDTKEKERHYRELLAHMRAQFRDRLRTEKQLRDLYEWIASLIDNY